MKKNKILSTIIISLLCLSIFAVVLPQVQAGPVPQISVTTTTDKTSAQLGDTVAYTFEVTNTGKVTLFGVSLVSNQAVLGSTHLESGRANDKLESGETWIYTATYTVTDTTPDPLVNTATATANTRKGISYSDTDVHNVYLYGTEGDMLPDVLTSPNQERNGGWYGCSVAVGEGVIVVGAAYESIPNPLYDPTLRRQTEPSQIYGAGRVYIYSAVNGDLLSTLTSPNPTAPGWFGYSVAVGDGVIVVGAPKETSGSVTSAGNAYIFDADTLSLTPIATLTGDNPVSNGDGYGYGVSVAVNNGIIAVGSSWETVNSVTGAGKVYLYNVADRIEKTFSPLISEEPETNGRFGFSVAISGEVIAVGAPYEDIVKDSDTIEGAGAVYIFNAANGAFVEDIVSPNAQFYGDFGFSLAADTGKIVIGAFSETVSGLEDAGRAYVYDIAGVTIQTLASGTPQYRGLFGNSVAIRDGFIVVGAEIENYGTYADAGNVYVYNTAGVLQDTLTSLDPEVEETFGWSVAVGAGVIVVGAYDAVYIFE